MAKSTGSTADTKKPYYEEIADRLIKQLEDGTAPWQKPWEPGVSMVPHNPITGVRYKGGNALWLTMQGRSDPRWMTYKQASSVEAQVKKGEKGTLIQYWKFQDQVPKRDANGKPEIDANGKKKMVTVQLDKPKVFSAVVFNAEQIQGLPPIEKKPLAWDRHERADRLLNDIGVPVHHDQADNAFYRPSTDSIHLPPREQFKSADNYYATALHEAGHATGHKSRLDRDLTGRFGSESYAKEELRAEIASMLLGDELQIGHDPGQHAAYVKSWIKVLKEDPKEILRAAKDAESIRDHILSKENVRSNTSRADLQEKHPAEPSAAASERDETQHPTLGANVPLKLAEKLAKGFESDELRTKFIERVQSKLSDPSAPVTAIKIRDKSPSTAQHDNSDLER